MAGDGARSRFVITHSGRPVAELRPFEEAVDRKRVQRAVAGLLRSRKGTSLGGLSLRQLMSKGRRRAQLSSLNLGGALFEPT